jgi:hypothetical protein
MPIGKLNSKFKGGIKDKNGISLKLFIIKFEYLKNPKTNKFNVTEATTKFLAAFLFPFSLNAAMLRPKI